MKANEAAARSAMELSGLDRFLWAAGFVGHVLLLVVLIVRKRFRRFPLFSSLTAFNILRTVALFFLQPVSPLIYFRSYWSLSAVDTLLQVLVLGEIAAKVFRFAGVLSEDVKRPLTIMICGSVCMAALVACLGAPSATSTTEWVVIRGNLFSTILVSLLFVGLLVISIDSGFTWRTHVGAIARGLGTFSIFSLTCQCIEGLYGTSLGTRFYHTASQARIIAYCFCLIYWIVGLYQHAPQTKPLPKSVELQLKQINSYVTSILHQLDLRRDPL